jgi:signal transduction histidine kinase
MANARASVVGAAVVLGAIAVLAGLGPHGITLAAAIGATTAGVLVAVCVVSAVSYRTQRDPAVLLITVGTGAAVLHGLAVPALVSLFASFARPTGAGWESVIMFAPFAATLALLTNLVFVEPWRERRGRAPLRVARVIAATAASLGVFDLSMLVFSPSVRGVNDLSALGGWPKSLLLVTIAIAGIVTVRALLARSWRAWLAGAGLAIAGAAVVELSESRFGGSARLAAIGLREALPALGAAFLGVGILATLGAETSRLRRTSDRAAEVMEGRAEIAATVAHDVRGPVSTIKGLATTTRKSYERLGDTERLEFVGMIEAEAGRLLDIVNQVALALKVDARTIPVHIRPQELTPIVRRAIELVPAGNRPVDVQAPADVIAPVDAQWFEEMVRQGVSNAVKFSADQAPVRIWLEEDQDGSVLVSIADEGPGIPAERREDLFLKFSRWRPTGYEDAPGSGLGLFICRALAREQGGDASLVAGSGGGTILRIRLPREGTRSDE